MTPVFVDTSALIAIGNRNDSFHSKAIEINNQLKKENRPFVTTNAILFEFGNTFSCGSSREVAIRMIETIEQSKKWNLITTDEIAIKKGLELFKKANDKEWGLVDCISIYLAKEIGITEIFSTDHHFEQAGLSILLK
jgi:uncharacterized protein